MNKPICIITECFDPSTQNVIEWLLYYKQPFIRQNVETGFQEFHLSFKHKKIYSTFHNAVMWNRRGYMPIIPYDLKQTSWINYLKEEQLSVLFAFEIINKANYIGSYQLEFTNNKINNLLEASKIGLDIPNTIVTNNKKSLFEFIEKDKRYITKSINESPYLDSNDFYYCGAGTFELKLNDISEIFAPSIIQEYIEKDIEIRTFFIEDYFYSMAIFSQNNEKTKIDFRNYDQEIPNRNVPFTLPDNILSKLKHFSRKRGYSTGSFDLILTPKGKYVFLEINPMGQYDWLSHECNYYIDKKIAELLIKKAKNEKQN